MAANLVGKVRNMVEMVGIVDVGMVGKDYEIIAYYKFGYNKYLIYFKVDHYKQNRQ